MLSFFHPLLQIDPREVKFARRGFTCSRPDIRERLEHVGSMFLRGYHAALQRKNQDELALQLDGIALEYRGFAYEGAAMALTLLDGLSLGKPWKRFSGFVAGPARKHIYMAHVGAGWACARLPWLRRRLAAVLSRLDCVLSGLVVDGYGFHEGYFHWNLPFEPKISRLPEDSQHIFYQGLGRSLWFVKGADGREITQTIRSFAPQFQADAWSGVGLGCAYAGGMDGATLEDLLRNAGAHREALAQGAAFAAKARLLAGNPTSHTNLACTVLCRISTDDAARLCDETLDQTATSDPCPYQTWRALMQLRLRAPGNGLQRTQEQLEAVTTV